jgi:hypothetical protein
LTSKQSQYWYLRFSETSSCDYIYDCSIEIEFVPNLPHCLQVKPVVPLIPFVSPSSGMESVPSMSGPKRKAGSPLRENEVLTDDNHLGLVTVEIVAGDEGSKVNVKV